MSGPEDALRSWVEVWARSHPWILWRVSEDRSNNYVVELFTERAESAKIVAVGVNREWLLNDPADARGLLRNRLNTALAEWFLRPPPAQQRERSSTFAKILRQTVVDWALRKGLRYRMLDANIEISGHYLVEIYCGEGCAFAVEFNEDEKEYLNLGCMFTTVNMLLNECWKRWYEGLRTPTPGAGTTSTPVQPDGQAAPPRKPAPKIPKAARGRERKRAPKCVCMVCEGWAEVLFPSSVGGLCKECWEELNYGRVRNHNMHICGNPTPLKEEDMQYLPRGSVTWERAEWGNNEDWEH